MPSTQAALSALVDHALDNPPESISITWVLRDRNGHITETRVVDTPTTKKRWEFASSATIPKRTRS